MGDGQEASAVLVLYRERHVSQLSADGLHIAFQSARGGEMDIWAARTDGTGLVQITKNHGTSNGSPRWAPDGRWLLFDSSGKDGQLDVWVVGSGRRPAAAVDPRTGNSGIPSWSRDGKRMYFNSDQPGGRRSGAFRSREATPSRSRGRAGSSDRSPRTDRPCITRRTTQAAMGCTLNRSPGATRSTLSAGWS